MVGFHALQSMTEKTTSFTVNVPIFCNYPTLNVASWPECVPHRSPGRLGICSIVGCTVRTSHETRRIPGDLQVHQTVLIDSRLEGIRGTVLGEFERETVGVE
jgi:hypothetical protein